MSIAKALGDNPDLKANPQVMEIFLNRINELLKTQGIGRTLQTIDELNKAKATPSP